MRIRIPDPCLVLLIGPAGAGKSTFARRHFKPTEVLSSDFFRALLSDDENDQAVSRDAFDLLAWVAERRLARGRLTVVDATNTTRERRKPLLALACRYQVPVVALVFDLPLDIPRVLSAHSFIGHYRHVWPPAALCIHRESDELFHYPAEGAKMNP